MTEDGVRLHGWWIRGTGRLALLFFHGNAGNAADRLERAKILNRRFGLDVFLVDYRGYGRSEGSPSEEGLYRDARAIYRAAIASGFRFGADRRFRRIARRRRGRRSRLCAGRAREWSSRLRSLSLPEVARVHYPYVPSSFVHSRFDNLSKIAEVRAPKLFFVAEKDEVAPPFARPKALRGGPRPEGAVRGSRAPATTTPTPSGARRTGGRGRSFSRSSPRALGLRRLDQSAVLLQDAAQLVVRQRADDEPLRPSSSRPPPSR